MYIFSLDGHYIQIPPIKMFILSIIEKFLSACTRLRRTQMCGSCRSGTFKRPVKPGDALAQNVRPPSRSQSHSSHHQTPSHPRHFYRKNHELKSQFCLYPEARH